MEYTRLGKTDIEVSRVCLGCMSFGKPTMHAWTLDEAASEQVICHALALGINFFDTANCYSSGTSEEYLGRALQRNHIPRDKVVLASKVYFNEGRLSKNAIQREIEGSLKRLGTDYLDLYIIHRFDYDTPMEETMEALDGLPPVKVHCSVLAEQAIKAALSDYYTRIGVDPLPIVGPVAECSHEDGSCSCGL